MAEPKLAWGTAMCAECGDVFTKNSNSQKYCKECAKKKKSESRIKYAVKYQGAQYERVYIRVIKGYRDVITDHAKAMGTSLNSFLANAVDNQIARDLAEKRKEK